MKIKMFSLIAVLMLALSISAAAESTVTSDNGLGDVYVATGTEKPDDQALVMAVNPGDKIIISVENASDSITLISYKGDSPSIDNMQYINQYPQDTETITYEIRDINSTENGLYLLMINDGTNVQRFYYKVGRPVFVRGEGVDEGVNYFTRVDFTKRKDEFAGTTSVAYLASFTPAGGTVNRCGFNVKKNASANESVDVNKEVSLSGDAVFEFGITIYNLRADETDSVDVIINNLVVVPYVNYAE